MKKLLILLMAFSLLMACNNDKGPGRDNRSTNSRDKDDYRNDDRNNDDRNSDDRNNDDRDKDNRNTNRDDDPPVDDRDRDDNSNKSSGNWSSRDVDEFVNSCVGSAVDGGMDRGKATSYCECMQVKLERMYPNPNDAANIDINSSSMQKMVKDCLY